MPKAGAGSTKAIANAIKAKGELNSPSKSLADDRPGAFEVVLSNM
jgi:hypothetical protein